MVRWNPDALGSHCPAAMGRTAVITTARLGVIGEDGLVLLRWLSGASPSYGVCQAAEKRR